MVLLSFDHNQPFVAFGTTSRLEWTICDVHLRASLLSLIQTYLSGAGRTDWPYGSKASTCCTCSDNSFTICCSMSFFWLLQSFLSLLNFNNLIFTSILQRIDRFWIQCSVLCKGSRVLNFLDASNNCFCPFVNPVT